MTAMAPLPKHIHATASPPKVAWALKLFIRIRQQAFENGLICYPMGGNVDSLNGDVVILAPPFNASDAEPDEIVGKMATPVKQVFQSLHGRA